MSGEQSSPSSIPTSAEAPAPKGVSISKFITDGTKEVQGVWIPIGKELKVRVARFGNPRYEEALVRNGKQFSRGLRIVGEQGDALSEAVTKAMAETILLGWEGLLDETGKKLIPYSVKMAEKLLTDHAEFRRVILELAQDIDQFRKDEVQDIVGN